MSLSPAEAISSLQNPDAGIDGVDMQGQKDIGLLLLYNDSPSERNPLSLALSVDGGVSWQTVGDCGNGRACVC